MPARPSRTRLAATPVAPSRSARSAAALPGGTRRTAVAPGPATARAVQPPALNTSRVRLSDQLADWLAQQVREGVFPPGSALPTEAELVRQHGVSRTVVREAVSRLKSLGLLASRQGSGVYVRAAHAVQPLDLHGGPHADSLHAVLQVVEVRRALEGEAAALAAQRRTPAQLAAMREALAAVDTAVAQGRDGVEEDLHFHHVIAQATGNVPLIATLDYLMEFLREGTRVTRANEARRADMMDAVRREHQAVLRAIERGDAQAARRAATRHMAHARERLNEADSAFWAQEGAALAQPLIRSVRRR